MTNSPYIINPLDGTNRPTVENILYKSHNDTLGHIGITKIGDFKYQLGHTLMGLICIKKSGNFSFRIPNIEEYNDLLYILRDSYESIIVEKYNDYYNVNCVKFIKAQKPLINNIKVVLKSLYDGLPIDIELVPDGYKDKAFDDFIKSI